MSHDEGTLTQCPDCGYLETHRRDNTVRYCPRCRVAFAPPLIRIVGGGA